MNALDAAWQGVWRAAPEQPCLRDAQGDVTRAGLEAAADAAAADVTALLRTTTDASKGAATGATRGAATGTGPQVVAWFGSNSAAMLADLLACARLGHVWLPLNTRLSDTELIAQLQHSRCALLRGHLQAPADQQARIERLRQALVPSKGPHSGLQAGDTLLVYTSGTTGHPKAALHTDAGLCANARMAADGQGLTARDRVLAALPMFHVGGLCIQTLPALLAGAWLRVLPAFDATAWLDAVEADAITTSLLVPATMRALLQHPRWATAKLDRLRFVNSGSSVVPVELIEAFHARGIPVAQVYGATETGPYSVALPPERARAFVGCVGWPAPGVSVALRGPDDDAHTELQPGDEGELLLQGPNLMRGYLPPAEGAPPAGFRPDGWWPTGDIARLEPNGALCIVGRCDDLLISGGENVHPVEIEGVALQWPGVAECAVVGVPDERWGEVPVLVVIPAPGPGTEAAGHSAALDLDGLRGLLAERLARFKQPRQILLREALPKTALGKLQRQALRAWVLAGDGRRPA